MPEDKSSKEIVEKIATILSDFNQGNLSTLASIKDDPTLAPIAESLSKIAKTIAAQASPAANDISFIVDSLGIGIWKWDLVTNSLEWDKNMYRLYGCDPKDFSGAYDAWESSLSAETKAKAVEEINVAVAGGKSFDTTFQVVHKNTGKTQDIRTRAFLVKDDNGKPIKMWGINIDRSREAELENEIKSTATFLEHTGAMAKVGGWELDLKTGQVYMSRQTQLLHEIDENYTPPSYSTGSEWYPPESWPAIQQAVQNAIEHGKSYDIESPFITAKGGRIWVRVQGFPIIENGKTVSLRGTFQDITERKMRELESDTILQTMSEGLVILDHNGVIEKFNPEALSILGKGRTSMDFDWRSTRKDGSPFPREEHPAIKALTTRKPVRNVVMGISLPSGEERWVKINAIPFQSNTELKVAVTFADITTITQANLALRNLQEQSQFVLESMGIGIWKFNPMTQELFWDQSMYHLYELSAEDFSGHYQAWESSLSPEAKQKAVEELDLALSGKKDFDTTFEILTKLGNKKHIGGKGVVIRNDKTEPIMMYGINWDKTKEVASDNLLQSQKQLLENVLDNVPNMVFVKDVEDGLRFKLFNKAGQKLLGIREEQIIEKNDYDLFSKEQADSFTSKDREVFQRHSVVHIENEPINTPSGIRRLETFKVPTYKLDGSPHLLIGISTDITDKLALQESLEREKVKANHNAKLASLGEMSAGIAHEINNPVAIVLGTVRLIPKFANDPVKLKEKVKIIERASNRIAKIVSGLRKFSRSSEKNKHQLHPVSKIIKEAVMLTGSKSKRHSTPIHVECKTETQVFCDEVEVEQILVNLISNAIDAVKNQSEKWVRISVLEDEESVVLQVRDAGKGIPEDVRMKLFQPFFTTKGVGEGTGIGLSIVKGILDEHKATIEVLNQEPNTCFEIRFKKVEVMKNAA